MSLTSWHDIVLIVRGILALHRVTSHYITDRKFSSMNREEVKMSK